MNLEADVCIVGAGPGGALLGYLLAKNNISTIVVERHDGIDKEFRGEHLNKDGEAILKKYGLYEKVENEGLLLMERIEYWHHGQVIKTVTPAEGDQHVGIHVPQRNLLSVLIGESEPYPNYKLMMGTKVTELIKDEDGHITGVKARKDDQEVTINSSIVVGADGRFSTVRKLAEMPFQTIKHGYDLLWAKIPSPAGWEPTIKQTLVGESQLALFTQAGGFIQIGWNIEEGSYPYLKKQSFEPFIKQVTDAFPDLTETVQQHIQSWNDFILLKVQSCHCPTWVKDGLVIMGDSAHTMSPTGAFGINCALVDASVLSEVIMEALATNDTSASQLKKYENDRRNEIVQLQEQQLIKEASYKDNFTVPALA
ncbi:FAD-dependent monooxygenase [Bacillus sp. JJ1773]|uniref:FAD-dependent monooxygenase n=1 Tax=Bacillus sp. JJ1773 TaxID=3122965 RepID=UPI002FFD7698